MNGNCAGGTDWLRNLDSNCPVENRTVAAQESEESSVVTGGHSPAVPRSEGKDSALNHGIFKGDDVLGFKGCFGKCSSVTGQFALGSMCPACARLL